MQAINTDQLAVILEQGIGKPVYLGDLPIQHFNALNMLRKSLHVPPFASAQVWLYPNVVKKLQTKRLQRDKREPIKIAHDIIDTLMSEYSRVLPSRYKHIQSLDLMKPDKRKSMVVYLAKFGEVISLKSSYLQNSEDINKFASGGAVQPPMDSAQKVENAATSIIPGTRSTDC